MHLLLRIGLMVGLASACGALGEGELTCPEAGRQDACREVARIVRTDKAVGEPLLGQALDTDVTLHDCQQLVAVDALAPSDLQGTDPEACWLVRVRWERGEESLDVVLEEDGRFRTVRD